MKPKISFKSFFIKFFTNLNRIYFHSHLVDFILFKINLVLNPLFNRASKAFLIKELPKINFKFIVLFLFVISLSMAPESQVQLSTISSSRVNPSQSQFGIVFISPANVLLIPLLFIFLRQFRVKKASFRIYGFEIFLIFFLIIAQISIIFGINYSTSLIWMLKMIFSLVIYLIFSRIALKKNEINIIIYGILSLIFLEGALSIGQFLKGGVLGLPIIESIGRYSEVQGNVLNPIQQGQYFRVIGTLSHSNNLSNFLALLIPFTIIVGLNKNNLLKIISHSLFLLCLASTFLTFSRWGVVTNFFTIFVTFTLIYKYINFSFKNFLSFAKFYLIISLIFISALAFDSTIQNRFLNFSAEDKSLVTRVDLAEQSFFMIRENFLFGVGGGNFLTYFVNNDYTPNLTSQTYLAAVHNFHLLLISEVGIIGFLVIMLFIFSIIYLFFSNIQNLELSNKKIALGLFASFLAFNFNGLMTIRTFGDRVGFVFFLLLGLLIKLLLEKKFLPITHLSKSTH